MADVLASSGPRSCAYCGEDTSGNIQAWQDVARAGRITTIRRFCNYDHCVAFYANGEKPLALDPARSE